MIKGLMFLVIVGKSLAVRNVNMDYIISLT